MWIKRDVFQELQRTATALKELADRYYAAVGARDAELVRLRAREIELLHEVGRHIAIAARASAVGDLWRLRVNELTIERSALLSQLVPGLRSAIPVIERDPIVTAPGVDFEDMGDASAAMTGALVGDGELRVEAPLPASVKGTPLFRDPAEADLD